MSKNTEMGMTNIEPSGGAGGDPAHGAGPGKSKALRAENKSDAEAAVFRLDAMSPGNGNGAGDGIGGGGTLTAPKGSKISHAAIFFAVLIVVGGGLLFAMRKIGINPMSAIANMTEPEVDLTRNNKSPLDHKRVLRDLSESAVKGQVPIEQVQKNPFEIPEVIAATQSADPELAAKQALERERKAAEERRKNLEATVAGLKIHGILGGSTPVARINDKAVRVGDKVEGILEVTAIQGRTVELECDGQTFVLSLDDDPNKAPRRKATKKK